MYVGARSFVRPEVLLNTRTVFFLGLIIAATGFVSAPIALIMGLVYGLSVPHPFHLESRNLSKFLLQASVVALGFGMNLKEVLKAGKTGFTYTAFSIAFVLAVGLLLGKLLKVRSTASFLITTGTAICGGSAIAAMGPIMEAEDQEMAVSLGTVFVLNSVALLTFPMLGWMFHLSQEQFGLWSALAIHDTSSVVGAASRYGALALVIGTTVKLARALWIVPLSVGTAAVRRNGARIHWPWFILLFCVAAAASTYAPLPVHYFQSLSNLGKLGLTATLYLIGTGLSRTTLKQVGVRPLLQGVVLWAIVGSLSLWLILKGVIAF
jgi:uncharacterized integral membrane protein (TIGR00698 family)